MFRLGAGYAFAEASVEGIELRVLLCPKDRPLVKSGLFAMRRAKPCTLIERIMKLQLNIVHFQGLRECI